MMGDIVNIKETTDVQLLEHFKRLEDIIPECMSDIKVNPFIQHIREIGEVSVSLIDFLNHSEFLELLTPGLLLICQDIFDKKADTEWYKIMLFIIEEKDDVEAFCENIPLCVESNIDCAVVRDIVEKSNSATDMSNALTMYMREHRKGESNPKVSGDPSLEYYMNLCKQQDSFISQLLTQIEELKNKEKELSNGLEEATFHSEFASINVEERCKELEMQKEELENQYADLKKMFDEYNAEKVSVSQKYEEERETFSVQAKQLENEVERLKLDMDSVERQFQNALKSQQASRNRFIEEKRSTLKYKIQVENLQKQITDISETQAKCENLENTVASLEVEKTNLEGQVEESLVKAEELREASSQQTIIIKNLNDSLAEKENEIARLMAQIRDLKEQAKNPAIMQNPSSVAAPTEPQGVFYNNDVSAQETMIEEEVKEFPDSQLISFESGLASVKRKSNWFTNLIAQHSKKSFLKNSRQDQENMIFIKMMEMRYPTDKVQKVRSSLSEHIPCFDLYKLICGEPSIEELDAFFDRYSQAESAFAG